MNSTPISSARIMRLTALLPPPPTPITRISAKFSESDLNGISEPLPQGKQTGFSTIFPTLRGREREASRMRPSIDRDPYFDRPTSTQEEVKLMLIATDCGRRVDSLAGDRQ